MTGTTPLDKTRLRTAAFVELIRMIKEEEPPKPSTRLTQSHHSLAGVAVQRRSEPARLARDVRGELDWIVMRCLEKDRTRRYSSASGLARDIERHLRDEAVEACPPRASYRMGKLVRRHRATKVATGAIVFIVVAGLMSVAWAFVQAERVRRVAVVAVEAERYARMAQAERVRAEAEVQATSRFLQKGMITGAEADEQAGPTKDMPRDGAKTKPERTNKP